MNNVTDSKNFTKKNQQYSVEVYGAAHNIFYKCNNCNHSDKILADISSMDKEKIKKLKETSGPWLLNHNDSRAGEGGFSINKQLIMAGQLTGNGTEECRIYCNFLGIGNGLTQNMQKLQNKLHPVIKKIKTKVILDNITLDKLLSDKCKHTNRSLLSVAGDCRLSTVAGYAATDGVYTVAGNYSNLFLTAKTFSSHCNKCSTGIVHYPLELAKNCDIHAKAMEARGAHTFVTEIFNCHNFFVREFISDDHSSIRRICKHKNKDLLECGVITELPRYDNGKVKPDNGELPVEHIKIDFQTDRNHRVRTVVGEIFAVVRKQNEDCIGTTHDAERLKRNLSYAIRSNCEENFDELVIAVKSVLEHHFNCYDLCGTWYQCKGETKE